jgi:outer membrane lipoprotein-sorting protein
MRDGGTLARRPIAAIISAGAIVAIVASFAFVANQALGAALLVDLTAGTAFPQSASADDSFESIYRRGAKLNADLKTLTAHFTETTTSSLLTRPLTASGTVAVERPSRVVLHYLEPEPRDVLIEGDRLTIAWPGRHIRDVTNIASANRRIQKYFVESTPKELEESFEVASKRADDRPGTYRLTMTPKRRQIREGLSQLELWLDESSLLLSAMRMTFPNGDTKLMVFDHVVANVPVDPAVFTAAR